MTPNIFTRKKAAEVLAENLTRKGLSVEQVDSSSYPAPAVVLSYALILVHPHFTGQSEFTTICLEVVSRETDKKRKIMRGFSLESAEKYDMLKTVLLDFVPTPRMGR
jgi:hypothetical protein